MSWVTGIVVYILAWWLVLFTILPWGNNPEHEPVEGHAPSAPAMPRLGLKFLITTIIAAIIWLVIYVLIEIKIIDLYAEAEQMMREDGI